MLQMIYFYHFAVANGVNDALLHRYLEAPAQRVAVQLQLPFQRHGAFGVVVAENHGIGHAPRLQGRKKALKDQSI